MNWSTPQAFFDQLNAEFHFTLDACASLENAKCPAFYTESDDALLQPWSGSVFVNPPYGRQIGQWITKAIAESRRGATVVCLLPARTDTAWWQECLLYASRIDFLRGRLSFVDENGRQGRCPFPSVVVVFKPKEETK